MKKTSLQAQTSDPRWQRKRLEILERDEWTCQACGDTEATLTVHHKSYRFEGGKFADYWDYDNFDLITLCNICHSEEESELSFIQKECFFILRGACNSAEEISFLLVLMSEWKKINGRIIVPELMERFSDVYKVMVSK